MLQSQRNAEGGTRMGRKDKGNKNVKKPKQDKSKKGK
jgi:hypothetical protein